MELCKHSGLPAAGIAVQQEEFMLSISFPELAFGAELVIKVHIRRLKEGIFHTVYGDGVPRFLKQGVVHDEVVLQRLVKWVLFLRNILLGLAVVSAIASFLLRLFFIDIVFILTFFNGISAGIFLCVYIDSSPNRKFQQFLDV